MLSSTSSEAWIMRTPTSESCVRTPSLYVNYSRCRASFAESFLGRGEWANRCTKWATINTLGERLLAQIGSWATEWPMGVHSGRLGAQRRWLGAQAGLPSQFWGAWRPKIGSWVQRVGDRVHRSLFRGLPANVGDKRAAHTSESRIWFYCKNHDFWIVIT